MSAFIDKIKLTTSHEHILSFDISEVGYTLNPDRQGVIAPVFKWKIQKMNGINPY